MQRLEYYEHSCTSLCQASFLPFLALHLRGWIPVKYISQTPLPTARRGDTVVLPSSSLLLLPPLFLSFSSPLFPSSFPSPRPHSGEMSGSGCIPSETSALAAPSSRMPALARQLLSAIPLHLLCGSGTLYSNRSVQGGCAPASGPTLPPSVPPPREYSDRVCLLLLISGQPRFPGLLALSTLFSCQIHSI